MLSGPPMSDVTSSIVMPIASFENLLLRAGVPTISPSKLPSRDLTTRVGPNLLGAPAAVAVLLLAEVVDAAAGAVLAGAGAAPEEPLCDVAQAPSAAHAETRTR